MDQRPAIEEAPPGWTRRFWHRIHHPFPEPHTNDRLLARLNPRDGEKVLRVVPKHIAVFYPVPLAAIAVFATVALAMVHWNTGTQLLFLISLIGLVVTVVRAYVEWRDVFIVTNWRVVRLSGVLTARVATMPINRILDMTMTRTPLGRILDYGHFVFESAAQEQGLREIKFVPDILTVDRQINDAVNKENRRRERIASERPRVEVPATDVETTDPLPGV